MTAIAIESEKKFDVIICFEALEHVEEHDKVIAEIKRVLKDDGIFIVSMPNKYIYSDLSNYENPWHKKELYLDEFEVLLRSNFKNVLIYGQKVFPTSNIFSISEVVNNAQELAIEKMGGEFSFVSLDKKEARYFIAVSSDYSIKDPIESSYMVDTSEYLFKKNVELKNLQSELEAIHNSHGWKFLTCYYKFRDKIFPPNTQRKALAKWLLETAKRTKRALDYFIPVLHGFRWFLLNPNTRKLSNVWSTYKAGGIRLCWDRAVERFSARLLSYDPFRNQLSNSQSKYILEESTFKPLFSIVVPVHKVACEWLEKCISSVVNQHYTNWELILVDDGSQRDDLKQLINAWALQDNRIHAYYLDENCGVACTTNVGIKQAKGEFIGFLDHDDELTPDALTWIVWTLNKNPDALWLYSDEDKISQNGTYHSPYFKPDFSTELLLSNMYTCHLSVYSADFLSKVGGLREYSGAQDHDLALRLSEIIPREKIVHIPRVLYHWRQIQGSTASRTIIKPEGPTGGRKAVTEALQRRNIKGKVTSYELCQTIYQIEFEPTKFPKVSIIIPTRNALALVKKCIDSARKCTQYPNFEIIVINNASDDKQFLDYIRKEESEGRIKVLHYDNPFNHSEMNNIAVNSVESEFVLFMNNDVEILSDNWLEQLIATIDMDTSIATVGCLLLYPDGKIQHGGIILGINSTAGHAHKYLDAKSSGYFGRLYCLQEMSGITAALSLVRRLAFQAVGGFDSEKYPTSWNDVDLCIRLRKQGFRCIYNPMVRAIHHELKTRPISPEEFDYQKRLRDDYPEILSKDPFYNPNLSLDNEQFQGYRSFPIEEQIPELRCIRV